MISLNKICPFISSQKELTPCIQGKCMLFDEKIKTCKVVLVDQNIELVTRKLIKDQQ